MTVDELKEKVAAYREELAKKNGKGCVFGENGPVGMNLMDAVVAFLADVEARIDRHDDRLADLAEGVKKLEAKGG